LTCDRRPDQVEGRYQGGVLSTVADQDTLVPGGGATFDFFSEPDVHAGEVVFDRQLCQRPRPYFRSSADTRSIGIASTVRPRPVTVVARRGEL
jgi:hypothetical protein